MLQKGFSFFTSFLKAKARHKKAARVFLDPDRSAHALLRCVRSFARLDGHEAKELGEERDEHDRDQDGRDVFDHDAPRCTPTELR